MPAAGVLTLHIGEHEVGSGRIRTQPGKFSIGGEGLNIGKDGAEPVTDDYPGAYRGPSPAAPSTSRRRRLGRAVRRPGRRVTHGVHARPTPALAAHRRGVGRLPRPAASASVGNSQHGVLRHGDRRAVEQAVRVRVLEGVRNSGGTVPVGGRRGVPCSEFAATTNTTSSTPRMSAHIAGSYRRRRTQGGRESHAHRARRDWAARTGVTSRARTTTL